MVLQFYTRSHWDQFLVHAITACLVSAHNAQMCSPCRGLLVSLQDPRALNMTQICLLVLTDTNLFCFQSEMKVRVGLLGLVAVHLPAQCPKFPQRRHRYRCEAS